jgi:ATPase subunit of ABC transporter with duplicated ATPase domains
MIEVEGLTKLFGDFVAVRDLSFTVKPGEVMGLVGPNGAGKTTTLRCLSEIMSAPAWDKSGGLTQITDYLKQVAATGPAFWLLLRPMLAADGVAFALTALTALLAEAYAALCMLGDWFERMGVRRAGGVEFD